ncbi:MAG: biotin--[acetyl-CoA-carboxylase] ligase [Elusimicrobia bacterium]|nr:biotin--[acetyl-CoA-carboxylase] ligase [Elusimicrobiota bacterium]
MTTNSLPGVNEESRAIQRYLQRITVSGEGQPCSPFGCEVYHYDVIGSTQTQAKSLADQGAPEGTLVVARRQTAGYGRKGDAWNSNHGGLWFSFILRPGFDPSRAGDFSLACAEAIARALGDRMPRCVFEVKAPNDVLAALPDGTKKKICGLLLEGGVKNGLYEWLVVGVGVNINNELPEELGQQAATLEQIHGNPVARMPVLRSVLIRLSQAYKTFSKTL